MKIENTEKLNAQVILRPSPGKVFKLLGCEIYFTTACIAPNATLADIQQLIEEVPATSIPRTRSALEREVEITNRVFESLGEQQRVTAETLDDWKADVRARRELPQTGEPSVITEPPQTDPPERQERS